MKVLYEHIHFSVSLQKQNYEAFCPNIKKAYSAKRFRKAIERSLILSMVVDQSDNLKFSKNTKLDKIMMNSAITCWSMSSMFSLLV